MLPFSEKKTYTEVLDVGENLVVEGEVIARNDIDASFLLNVPVLKTESLGLGEKLSLGELPAPVCFSGFLQFTVGSHTRKTEDRAVIEIHQYAIALYYICNDKILTIEP